MSAPTPAPGDESPREGYYPDPSIPGYVRYWNGASWVPGTSRPAPQQSEPAPVSPHQSLSAPSPVPSPAAVDETGPMFFDEVDDPNALSSEGDSGGRQEPSAVWQADTSRQTGFGGDRDRRVSWGDVDRTGDRAEGTDLRTPGPVQDPTAGALPGMRGASTPEPPTPIPAPAPNPPQARVQEPSALGNPLTPGPGGGSASWAQQVHRLAQPDPAPQPQQ
ncbi:MAG TPA: DUF2510 domain-containing protein, partial [Streptomyces sp.]